MDCRSARLLLHFAGPGRPPELDPDEAEALRAHLADCADCAAAAEAERRADERLGAAMRAVAVPEGLRERLRQRLADQPVAWYRRRWVRGLVAAAAVLVAVGLGWSWFTGPRAVLDLEQVCQWANDQMGAPPETVEAWFAERGVVAPLPRELNYRLLTCYELVQFQGKSGVPRLQFERGEAQLRLYVLSARQFDLAAARAQERHNSGPHTVLLVEDPANRDVAYLLVFKGGPLEVFQTRPNQAT
jgi:hypothetical protein